MVVAGGGGNLDMISTISGGNGGGGGGLGYKNNITAWFQEIHGNVVVGAKGTLGGSNGGGDSYFIKGLTVKGGGGGVTSW